MVARAGSDENQGWLTGIGEDGQQPPTTPMHRSQLCADPNRRRTRPPGQTARKVLRLLCIVFGTRSLRAAPRQRLLISCEAMAEFVARLLINLERSADPTNAGVRASRSQLPIPEGRELLSRATTGHGDRTLRRETSCARKLCRGLVGHERAQAAQVLGHEPWWPPKLPHPWPPQIPPP